MRPINTMQLGGYEKLEEVGCMNDTTNVKESISAVFEKCPINAQCILGPAGSGKSYQIRERIRQDPKYAILAATTGVAAVNLGNGVTTIHSLLKFYDLASLKKQYEEGWLRGRFMSIARNGFKNIVIDEISMMEADMLQYIFMGACEAAIEVNALRESGAKGYRFAEPVGLILTGDFLQLPPVGAWGAQPKYAFFAECWNEFAQQTVRLTTQYRQSDEVFLSALSFARIGKGTKAVEALMRAGVEFVSVPLQEFHGPTLFATNSQVDKYNRERLAKVDEPEVRFTSKRWGKEPKSEWSNIPETLVLKAGARIMVLTNCPKTFEYVNGDIGEVLKETERRIVPALTLADLEREDIELTQMPVKLQSDGYLPVRITRVNGYTWQGKLAKITRQNYQVEEPKEGKVVPWPGPKFNPDDPAFWEAYNYYVEKVSMRGVPYFDPVKAMWVVGEIQYMPVRLGYALTVHKSQGLTLDAIQIDARPSFAGMPGLMYVALSRVKDPKGIKVIGNSLLLGKRIAATEEAKAYA